MGKILIIPARPEPKPRKFPRTSDVRYLDGQRVLVEAIKYLVREDPVANREAVGVLSEHFRTQFRMSDSPLLR